MKRQDIINFCLTFPSAYEDYPFREPPETATAVIRHRGNGKSFALVIRRGDRLYLNLKCDPYEAEFMRQAYRAVIPGWHMDKRHWNTVVLGAGCDVPEREVKRMVKDSYGLTRPKRGRRG